MVFNNFINSEIPRLKIILTNNRNINVRFYSKKYKFGELKYNERKNKHILDRLNIFITSSKKNFNTLNSRGWGNNLNVLYHDKIDKYTICEKWISLDGLNCYLLPYFILYLVVILMI